MRALHGVGRTVPLDRVLREHRAVLLPLAVVLVINLVVLVALVLPLSRSVASGETRAATAERQRVAAEAELRQAESLRDGRTRAAEDLATFYKDVLPANTAAARRILQLKLRQQARSHEVQYEGGAATEEAIDGSNLLRLTMRMRLSGEYDDIRGFLYELETAPEFLVIDNIQLAEGTQPNAPLAVSLDVSTYYRAAAAGATTAADAR